MKLSDETLQDAIDFLHQQGNPDHTSSFDQIANTLQFGVSGRDPSDGHRCIFCEKLCGGDSRHRCW